MQPTCRYWGTKWSQGVGQGIIEIAADNHTIDAWDRIVWRKLSKGQERVKEIDLCTVWRSRGVDNQNVEGIYAIVHMWNPSQNTAGILWKEIRVIKSWGSKQRRLQKPFYRDWCAQNCWCNKAKCWTWLLLLLSISWRATKVCLYERMYRIRCFHEDGLLILKKLLPFKDSNVEALPEFIVILMDVINQFGWQVSASGY